MYHPISYLSNVDQKVTFKKYFNKSLASIFYFFEMVNMLYILQKYLNNYFEWIITPCSKMDYMLV
jgi:hypothetical protein